MKNSIRLLFEQQNFEILITDNLKDVINILIEPFLENHKHEIEQIILSNYYVKNYFCIAFHQEKPVFFTHYQLIRFNENTARKISENGYSSAILSILLGISKIKILVLGNIFRNNQSNYIFDYQHINEKTALNFWVTASKYISDKTKATAIIAKEVKLNSIEHDFLQKNGFEQDFPDELMNMEIDKTWKSLEDYHGTLTRKYASRFKKVRTLDSNLIIKNLHSIEIENHKTEIQKLYLQTIEDQDFVFSEVNENFWTKMKNILKDNFQIYGIYIQSKLIGFYSTIEENNSLEIYYIGYDKLQNKKHSLYFNILFWGLENAILKNKNELKLGRTSIDAKLSLGAKSTKNIFAIKLNTFKAKMLDSWLNCKTNKNDAQKIERNPFKVSQPTKSEKMSSTFLVTK